MTTTKRAWAIRLDEFKGEPIYRVYPTFSRNMVRSLARDQEHRKGKVVLVEIREVALTRRRHRHLWGPWKRHPALGSKLIRERRRCKGRRCPVIKTRLVDISQVRTSEDRT